MNTSAAAPSYRADIDGLRAVSILLVVLYHAQPWLVPGGFVGVDVFFVISGFLITRLILGEMEDGDFSFLTFYARRVRRIFPALIVVLFATFAVGWFLLLPEPFALLGSNIAAGAGFVSNLFQLTQAGYFAPDAADNPLLHLWSLGIEEQFYIVWPPLLLAIAGARRRRFYIWVLALLSFGASLLVFAGFRDWCFYAPIPRGWELLAGGLLAEHQLAHRKGLLARIAARRDLAALGGLALILAAGFGLDRTSLFPGLAALLPVGGAVLLILSEGSRINRLVLSSRPMVWLGLISYPLYLWHWPLLSYLSIVRNGVPNFLEIWLAVLVAVLLAWLTWRFVETPLRRRPQVVPQLACGLAALAAAGIVTVAASGVELRFPPEIRAIAAVKAQDNSGFRDGCFMESGTRFGGGCVEPGGGPLLLLWGDSTAAALSPGLRDAAHGSGFRFAHFAAAACAPILDAGVNARCDAANADAFAHLASAHPDLVLLHAQWDRIDPARLRTTIDRLAALKVPRVVILGPVPVWKRTLPQTLVNFYRFHHAIPDRIAAGVSGAADDLRMNTFSGPAGVGYISAWHLLCNDAGCLTRTAHGDVLVTDIVHLSEAGSAFLAAAVAGRLFAAERDGARP